MPYTNLTILKKRISEKDLINLTNDTDQLIVNEDVINECIKQADGIIDAHLAYAYTLPLTIVSDLIVNISCDITIYLLLKRRVDEMPEAWLFNYQNTIKTLESLKRGDLILNGNETIISTGNNASSGNVITNYWGDNGQNYFDY